MSNLNLFNSIVNPSLEDAIQQLGNLLDESDFSAKMHLIFGDNLNLEEAQSLIKTIVEDLQLPELEIINTATINGGNGAFDSLNNKIYLSQEFLTQNINYPEVITNLLLEEIGHYLDSELNDTDSSGDEGAIFAAIAQGQQLSSSELATLKAEDDTTTVVINGQETTVELNTTFGNITLDGNLGDWTSNDRLDFLPGTGQPGYEVYGKLAGDAYVFAIKSDGTAIGSGTTVWLNTDRDASTGYQIFDSTGGAEYNVNFFTDNQPYLYTGAAAENLVNGALDHAYDNSQQVVEFAVPVSQVGNAPQSLDVLIDVNNQVFLPGNFGTQNYTIFTDKNLPERTDESKKVGIVFSQTTADQFFGLPDLATNQTAYSQLFMSVQEEVMMSGVPFDLLTEDDLKDINKLVNYDSLIFPSIRNVQQADVQQIQDTLTDAVYNYNIGIVAAGDFMTNSETGDLLAGDPYSRMKSLLGLQPQAFGSGSVSLTAEDTTQPVVQSYDAGEVIREYQNPIGYAAYQSYADETVDVLVNQTVDGQTYNAVVATETGGRNVHFATTSYLGDNNLAWEAVRWSTFDNQPSVSLSMTRNESLFLSRNDMDVSQFFFSVNPEDGSPGVYDVMLPIVDQWKTDFNFVGSYYINIGNSVEQGIYTDWELSRPYYDALLANGNEIGTHSYTHFQEYAGYNPTNNTNFATPEQIEFEFNQSKQIIEQQLGIEVTGSALPGAPEQLPTSEEIIQYFDYISGGASFVGGGFPGAFGFLSPDQESVYFAPNLWFDFTLIGFGIPVPDGNGGFVPQPLTAEEAEVEWIRQFNEVTSHSNKPIVLMPWHDYGPTNFNGGGYNQQMFTSLIEEAYNQGAEFVTLDDASKRIKTFEQAQLFVESSGNTITAEVISDNVGDFALDLTTNNQIIQSVDNWYAYDEDSVFLPRNGGQFTINLSTVQDNVTRITELPMRAELETVTGNGTDLEYSFFGEGKVVVEVANPGQVSVIGADGVSLNGSTVEMVFANINQHNARILAATTGDDFIEGAAGQDILIGSRGNDVLYGEQAINAPVTIFATGFESAPDAGDGFTPSPLDGWNSSDGNIEYWFNDSAEGNNHIELNEDPINFYPDARQIYRDITTEAGKFYELTFQYAPRPGYNAAVNAIAFKLDGNTLLNVAENGSNNSSPVWKTYTVSFTGNGSTQRLEFLSTGTPVNYGRGGYLDDIKLLAYDADPSIGGDDTISGGLGNDNLNGGAGNDIIYGDNAASTVFSTGFEAAPDGSNAFTPAPLDGWNSTDGNIEYKVGGSAEGNNHIELNEDPINFYPDARQIYRDVNTEAGKFYELTFQYAPRPGYNAAVNAIAFKLDGNTLLNVAENGSNNSSPAWRTYTVSFTGNGSTQRLEFLSTGTPVNYGRGGYLDDIKLLAYQEDPTLGGNDILDGGSGNDVMTGGSGNDTFVFANNESLLSGELDIIKDFEVDNDKVEFQGWGNINASSWFSGIVSQGLITNTLDGALLTSNLNNSGGQILFEGVSVENLDASDFSFT